MSTETPPPRPKRIGRFGKRQRFRPDRPTWSWQGLVAFTLAAAIVLSICTLIIGVIVNIQNQPMPENIGGMLTAVISGLIGSVATFLGRVGSNSPDEQTHEERNFPANTPAPPPPPPPNVPVP